jgi:hypothetical protein
MQSLQNKYVMEFTPDHPENDHFFGVVTGITEEFFTAQIADDFEFAGTAIVPIARLKAVRFDAGLKCMTRIMQHNGQLQKLKSIAWLSRCQTFAEVVSQLMKRGIWPAVTIVYGKDAWFFIGPLTVAEENGFCIRNYTVSGKWTKPQGLRMQDVTLIEFGSKYGKHFNHYMRTQPT